MDLFISDVYFICLDRERKNAKVMGLIHIGVIQLFCSIAIDYI